MNKINPKVLLPLILMVVLSCEEPETIVTNIVHPDGSVTRKIEMRNTKNEFDKSDLQVPFDNTWSVTDSLEVSSNGDTTKKGPAGWRDQNHNLTKLNEPKTILRNLLTSASISAA